MDLKRNKTITAILGILLLVITGGLIYSILSTNSKIASLNFVIYYQGEMQKKEKSELTATLTAMGETVQQAENKYEDLNRINQDTQMQLSIADEKLSAMRDRLMCPSTIPLVDYSDNGTVSAALKEFTSDYKATDDHYEAVQKNANITFHNLKSSRTQSFFMVYFADETNGRVNGIFDVLGQCWVNLNNQ